MSAVFTQKISLRDMHANNRRISLSCYLRLAFMEEKSCSYNSITESRYNWLSYDHGPRAKRLNGFDTSMVWIGLLALAAYQTSMV